MKRFIVTIRYQGLTGPYDSKVDVEARNHASARKKGARTIGNRDGEVISVCEAFEPGPEGGW